MLIKKTLAKIGQKMSLEDIEQNKTLVDIDQK